MKEKRIESWKEFNDILEEIPAYKDAINSHWVYRGQSKSDWGLTPILVRTLTRYKYPKDEALGLEAYLIHEFKKLHKQYTNITIPKYETHEIMVWLAVMQHYSCPTRLLDWSDSPFVGLYFAVEDNFDDDGSLYLLNSFELEVVNKIVLNSDKIKDDEKLLFNTTERDLVLPFISAFQCDRSIMQKGTHTFATNIESTHETIISETFEPQHKENCFWKIIIPKELKIEFLARLKIMNIDASSLFINLDGLGKSLKHIIDIKSVTK